MSTFDVDGISTEALLFQTGYLTVADEEAAGVRSLYRLDCREVNLGLNRRLLRAMAPATGGEIARQAELAWLTAENDPEGVKELFEAFFASIHRYRKNGNAKGCWAALVYALRGGGARRPGRGSGLPWTPGHGRAGSGLRASVRVQGRGPGAGRRGAGPGTRLRRQVPAFGGAGEFGREERNIVGFETA